MDGSKYGFKGKCLGYVLIRGKDKVGRKMRHRGFLYALGWAWTMRTYRVEPGVAGSNAMTSGFCLCDSCGLLGLDWGLELDTSSVAAHPHSSALDAFSMMSVAELSNASYVSTDEGQPLSMSIRISHQRFFVKMHTPLGQCSVCARSIRTRKWIFE